MKDNNNPMFEFVFALGSAIFFFLFTRKFDYQPSIKGYSYERNNNVCSYNFVTYATKDPRKKTLYKVHVFACRYASAIES